MTYEVAKRMDIAVAHNLNLDYDSKCTRLHGHNLAVTVHLRCDTLDDNGMVADFAEIKKAVVSKYDHKYLNDIVPKGMNPTSENLARLIALDMPFDAKRNMYCYQVDVRESENNEASFSVYNLVELGKVRREYWESTYEG